MRFMSAGTPNTWNDGVVGSHSIPAEAGIQPRGYWVLGPRLREDYRLSGRETDTALRMKFLRSTGSLISSEMSR